MKKSFLILLSFCVTASAFSQNPVNFERIVNDLDWENCSESDVILAFKDNVVKREKEEAWDGGAVSSFILKNVKIGESTSDANIIVSKYNRKLLKIGGIRLGKNYDWSNGADKISQELEEYFSSYWGKEHKKSIDYVSDYDDEKTIYTNIECEWGNSFHNEKASKGSFYLMHRAKIVVISVEPK